MHAEGGGCKKIGVPTPQGVTDILSANPRPAYYTPCARLRATIFPNCSGPARTNGSFNLAGSRFFASDLPGGCSTADSERGLRASARILGKRTLAGSRRGIFQRA